MTAKRTRFLSLAAFLIVFGLAACDSDPSALVDEDATSTELNDLAARLSTDLTLSTEQAQTINSLLSVSDGDKPAPGRLWTVAAELQQTLTDEQKATLFEQVEQRKAELAEGMQGRRFNRGGQGRGRRFNRDGQGRGERLNRPGAHGENPLLESLTEEQKDQMKALRDANREEMKALFEARQDGSLSPEDFREQAKALREKNHAAMQALLTDEQKATLAERREEIKARFEERKETAAEAKEAAAEARAQALALTADQEATLASIHEDHQAARKALVEQIRAGDLDRDAVKAELETLRDAHKVALAEILTPEQIEIVEIHHALTGGIVLRRVGRRGDGPRGFGSRRGFRGLNK